MIIASPLIIAAIDECIAAGELYECNNRNNPSLVSGIMGQINGSSPATPLTVNIFMCFY
jgi:hypothetical protein